MMRFTLVDQGISQSLISETDYANTKLALLIAVKKTEPALEFGKHLIDELFTDDSDQLISVAGVIVRPEDFSPLAAAEKKNGSDKPEKSARRSGVSEIGCARREGGREAERK